MWYGFGAWPQANVGKWRERNRVTGGKSVREQPYDINVRDNWIIIGVREQPYSIQVCSDRWLVDPGINGGVVLARWSGRAERGRAEVARWLTQIGFPISIRNSNFFPPAFIREGRGCGEKNFSDRRGRGGREGAWQRGEGLFVRLSL